MRVLVTCMPEGYCINILCELKSANYSSMACWRREDGSTEVMCRPTD